MGRPTADATLPDRPNVSRVDRLNVDRLNVDHPNVSRVDLHCHTRASRDSIADPVALLTRAVERGLTHLAITDHDTIDGALPAAASAPEGLTVIVGCEVLTTGGDLILLFLERPIPMGLSPREAIAAGREQGALVGIPHPYDPGRRSLLLDPANEALLTEVDWVEAWNGRVGRQQWNEQAATLARRCGIPGIGVSDAHALLEIGTIYTMMTGDPSTPAGLLAALRERPVITGPEPVAEPGRLRRLLRPRTGHTGAAR